MGYQNSNQPPRRLPNSALRGRRATIQHYWVGHRNINHTVRYTELSPHRFRGFLEGSMPGRQSPRQQASRLNVKFHSLFRTLAEDPV
jgi:hypothetical protein